jgi:hypothetical protein
MPPNDPVRIVSIDEEEASAGLDTAFHNSLAYRIAEIERHLHSYERWLGLAASPSAETHRADQISGVAIPAPFVIDAGNNAWGLWVQVLGSADTPVISGSAYYDFHRLAIVNIERSFHYFVQVALGASAAAALSSGDFSDLVYEAPSAATGEAPILVQTRRKAAATKAWIRCICPGQDTATMSFFIGLHEYEG